MLKKVVQKMPGFWFWWADFWGVLGAVLIVFGLISVLIRIVIKSILGNDLCRMAQDVFPIRKCHEISIKKRANICWRDLFTNIGRVWSAGTGRGFVITCHSGNVKES